MMLPFTPYILDLTPLCEERMEIAKLEMRNASNSVHQDHILEDCTRRALSLLHLAVVAYA